MKKIALFLIAILPAFVFAQKNEGKITYKEEVKFEIDLPPEMEHMRDKLPSSQSAEMELLFNASSSLWQNIEKEEDENTATFEDTNAAGDGFRFEMKVVESESKIFKDLEKGKKTEKTDFMGKVFLINGDLEKTPWKLTGAQKTIAGYDCQQALFQNGDEKIEAWFTPQIAVSSGPLEFGALPGMILEVNIDEGKVVVTATKVELMKLEKNAIVAPKKGKKVSPEEYEAIVAEKTKEMQEENGGDMMKIEIRN